MNAEPAARSQSAALDAPELSVVSPFFNESEVLIAFCTELRLTLDGMKCLYEVVLVDDGSTDNPNELLKDLDWPQCKTVSLVKNAGHQEALDAGLRYARGDWILTLDADLQHPPSLIPQMLKLAQIDDALVVQAVRENRAQDGLLKRFSATVFYRGISILTGLEIVPHAPDFRLMKKNVVDVLTAIPEPKVFRLLLPTFGFPTSYIKFVASSRRAGASKYSWRKMSMLALNSGIQFSIKPLFVTLTLGVVLAFITVLFLGFVVWSARAGSVVPGWASTVGLISGLGSMQLIGLGVLGVYVGRIYEATKGRPRYVVQGVYPSSRSSS